MKPIKENRMYDELYQLEEELKKEGERLFELYFGC